MKIDPELLARALFKALTTSKVKYYTYQADPVDLRLGIDDEINLRLLATEVCEILESTP